MERELTAPDPRESAPYGQMELRRLREALDRARRMMQWCIDNGTDDATAARLRRGIEAIDRSKVEAEEDDDDRS